MSTSVIPPLPSGYTLDSSQATGANGPAAAPPALSPLDSYLKLADDRNKARQAADAQKLVATPAPAPGIPPLPQGYTIDQPQASDTGAIAGIGRALSGFVHLPGQVYDAFTTPPQNDREKQLAQRGTADLALDRIFAGPARAEQQKAVQAYVAGDEHMGNMHNIAAAVPVLGPIAGSVTDRYLKGDKSGALAELGTYLAAPKVAEETARTVANTVANVPTPRGVLANRMAQVPPGEQFSRADVLQAARDHGVNLDLADATDLGVAKAAKRANAVSSLSQGVIAKNVERNTAALNNWGDTVLKDASPVELNREQVGSLVKQNLLKQQSAMYDQASQYFKQVDNTVGGVKPDVTSVREIAQEILQENKDYYNKHPELRPVQAWKTVETIARGGDPLKEGQPKPAAYTWSDLQKLRSDLLKEAQSTDIVGSRSEGWLKHLEGAISQTMDESAGKLSPIDQQLYQKANGIWQAMKGTYDNPSHPFYHVVRALDGTTAGNAAANLKPEFVRQLQGAMGNSFSIFQRDAIARILDPKNSGGFDMRNLNQRLSRADVERLSAVLTPEQMRDLHLMGKVASRVTADVNPSGTAKAGTPLAEAALLIAHPVAGAAELGGNLASAKALTSQTLIDYLTKKPKPGRR